MQAIALFMVPLRLDINKMLSQHERAHVRGEKFSIKNFTILGINKNKTKCLKKRFFLPENT